MNGVEEVCDKIGALILHGGDQLTYEDILKFLEHEKGFKLDTPDNIEEYFADSGLFNRRYREALDE